MISRYTVSEYSCGGAQGRLILALTDIGPLGLIITGVVIDLLTCRSAFNFLMSNSSLLIVTSASALACLSCFNSV